MDAGEAVMNQLLDATSDVSVVRDTRIIFVTVGTPGKPDGSMDLTFLKN